MSFSEQPVSDKIHTEAWDEQKLVSLLRQKDENAFRILIQKYQNRLLGIACAITLEREESLEIVQDVFFKAWKNIHTFRGDAKLFTWLRRITINETLNWQRKWKRRFRWHHRPLEREDGSDYPELGTDTYDPGRLYQKKELENILWEKLRELPEDARSVFILREAEGLSYDEIAATLRIKRGTVSSRLFYARKRLKEMLGGYMDKGEEDGKNT